MWEITVEEIRGVKSEVTSAAVRHTDGVTGSSTRQPGHGALFLPLISPCPQYVVTMENLAAAVTLWIASPTSLENDER
jgi:hypothetical protein